MIRWGITANSHDAALAVFKDNDLLYAAHSERSSGIKNDKHLNTTIMSQALAFGDPAEIHWYENDWLKRIRQLYAGQYKTALTKSLPYNTLRKMALEIDAESDDTFIDNIRFYYHKHHSTHAAAGWYTAPFDRGAVLVIDSIGEFETLTVWRGNGNNLEKVYSQGFPHSLGLWYSSMTQRIGLKPNEDEYILMGMAAIGDPKKYFWNILEDFFMPLDIGWEVKLKHNLHRGCRWWRPELNTVQDIADIAAGTQAVYEHIFRHLVRVTRAELDENNIVLMGGCALNCVANSIVGESFDNVWIMPNPGDAGSAVGAVLDHLKVKMPYTTPYLGYNIEGDYPVESALKELLDGGMVGIANGKAEYGPRALGNRSLLADPRGQHMKDKVNSVKKRQEFRPFAPVIREELVSKYFDMPTNCSKSPYMQFVGRCNFPKEFPAITHLDGTSRVQTVTRDQHPGLYELLLRWEESSGCPILLNTSLNIKGEPIVDNEADAQRWQEQYNVPVVSRDNKDV